MGHDRLPTTVGSLVLMVSLGLVACAVKPGGHASPMTAYGPGTSGPAEELEEGAISVEGDQSEPGPAEAVATIDLDTVRRQMREGGGGFWTFLQAANRVGEQTYQVASGADFTGAFTIGNYGDRPLGFVFICVSDFLQVPCVEGEPAKTHRVLMGAEEDTTLQVRIAGLSEGSHDIVFAMFMHPDEHSTDWQFRADSRFMCFYDRITVYAGESRASPPLDLVRFDEPDPIVQEGVHAYAVSRHGGERWEESWHLEEVSPGESLEYFITRNNPEDRAVTYAFLGLLDYEQVPISGDHVVLYGQVQSHKRAMIRGEVRAPRAEGDYEFLVLVVDNPYLDQVERPTSPYLLSADVYTADRVLIRVQ